MCFLGELVGLSARLLNWLVWGKYLWVVLTSKVSDEGNWKGDAVTGMRGWNISVTMEFAV